MLRNSFKFLSLALAASLTVAPVSAIGWNSDSSRAGLLGLGFAVTTLVGVMVYKCFFSGKNTPEQKQKPEQKTATPEEKRQFYTNLVDRVTYNELGAFSANELFNQAAKFGDEVKKLVEALFDFESAKKSMLDKRVFNEETFNAELNTRLEKIRNKLGAEMTSDRLKKMGGRVIPIK